MFRLKGLIQNRRAEQEKHGDVQADALLARVAKKDRTAFAELYERFQRPLFSYLFHLLGQKEVAEDVLQEVMLIIWQKAHTFQGKARVDSWLFGIAHNQAFKLLRRGEQSLFVDLAVAQNLPDQALDPEHDILRKCTQEEVAQALQDLTSEHREVLELAFFHDFGYAEIAAITAVPVGTVKSRASYARRALKATLLRNGWEV